MSDFNEGKRGRVKRKEGASLLALILKSLIAQALSQLLETVYN